jgi:4-hydroxybenzoate polyprenyltransferase
MAPRRTAGVTVGKAQAGVGHGGTAGGVGASGRGRAGARRRDGGPSGGGILAYLVLFVRLVKFEHSVFALPFAYSGAFLAAGSIPGFRTMFWITLAMVGARSLAMALNRLFDSGIDAQNPRTAGRELPTGRLGSLDVWVFSGTSLAVLLLAVFNLPPVTWYLWPIPMAAFVVYPFTKRWTWLCHLFLGVTIGLGPVGAWVAVTGKVTWQPFLLGAAVALWIAGFDIIYACMDLEFDRRQGIHSIPADFGLGPGLWATRVIHLFSVVLLAGVGLVTEMGPAYYAGVLVCGGLLFYENWVVRRRDLAKVGLAFMTMNGIISVVFCAFTTVAVLLAS